jgi:transposase
MISVSGQGRVVLTWVMSKSVQITPVDRQKIQEWIAAHGTPQQVVLRCRIVLGASEGEADSAISRRLSVNRNTVILWRKRFVESGLDGLWDVAPGRGRKPICEIDKIAAIVEATLQTKPAGMTHGSCRTLAAQQGVSKSTVNNIWRAHNLQPHRTETFKLSRDPKFLEKMTDVVGLYLNPPQKAIVLCVDEKSPIQALDRTQPGLPIKKGRCGTMTHDYKRNGTTTLFAALETLQGKVVGECHQRRRHQEFLKFLRRLDHEFPGDVPLHLIRDNYGTHKHEKVTAWLNRHPRFVSHFVPTSSRWMNLVERWFGHLDNKAIKRGVFLSVEDLQASIAAFLNAWNASPKPFVWTATVQSIQEKLTRCRRTLEQIQPGCTSPKLRKHRKNLYSYFADTTLAGRV